MCIAMFVADVILDKHTLVLAGLKIHKLCHLHDVHLLHQHTKCQRKHASGTLDIACTQFLHTKLLSKRPKQWVAAQAEPSLIQIHS